MRPWLFVIGALTVVFLGAIGAIGMSAAAGATRCTAEECPALVFKAGQDVCYRLTRDGKIPGPFERKRPPSRSDREEAERWLLSYPVCETHLNQKISEADTKVHAAASAPSGSHDGGGLDGGTFTDGQRAACELNQYKMALVAAQIDQHEAYNIIQDELHEEIDYKLWREQIMLGATFLGGAGDVRDIGLDLHWDSRKLFPAGFRYSLSIGLHGTRNLILAAAGPPTSTNDLPTPRDPTLRLSVPLLAGLSWSWIHSSIFVAGGAAWTRGVNSWAVVGEVGIGFLQNWVRHGSNDRVGPATELRFVVEPWIPIDHQAATSVMFGLELGAGAGFIRSPCNPEDPTNADCPRLSIR